MEKDWDCPECKETFDQDVALQAHMKAEHDIEMVLPPDRQAVKQEEDDQELLEEMKISAQQGDEEAIKALAIAAGEARLANFHCDVTVGGLTFDCIPRIRLVLKYLYIFHDLVLTYMHFFSCLLQSS